MCTRVTLASGMDAIAEAFPGVRLPADIPPRYNIAPTDILYAITVMPDGSREMARFVWGLVPHWAKDTAIGHKLLNARSETLDKKPSFKGPLRDGRCLVVVDGFYEWRRSPDGKTRIPYRFTVGGGRPFALAGLWDVWRGEGAGEAGLRTCAVITIQANTLVAKIHDRMPVIMPPESYDAWFNPAQRDTKALMELLRPFPAAYMGAVEVSQKVNNPRNEGPDLIEPA